MLKSEIMTTPNSAWRNINTQMPPLDEPVWLWLDYLTQPVIGCRTNDPESRTGAWAQCYDDWFWNEETKRYDAGTKEITGIEPTHWQFLPDPPIS